MREEIMLKVAIATDVEGKTKGIALRGIQSTYPLDAKGWVDGVYREREEEKLEIDTLEFYRENKIRISSSTWTETEETGFGVYEYIETTELTCELDNGNYMVDIMVEMEENQGEFVSIKANRLSKINKEEVKGSKVLSFPIAIVDGILTLKVYQPTEITKKEDCISSVVHVNKINIRPYEGKIMEGNRSDSSRCNIYLLSDSTVMTYDDSWVPQTGWGQKLIDEFNLTQGEYHLEGKNSYVSDKLHIYNRAIGGRSIKSFLLEGRLDEVLLSIQKCDYLFIQFGHNDDSKARPNRYVNIEEYKNYLNWYINGTLQRGGIPVLISPVARRNCEEHGEFRISFLNYRNAMIEVSQDRNIPFLDLGAESTKLLQQIGEEESKKLYMIVKEGEYPDSNHKNGVTDNTHLREEGAIAFAGIVAKLLKDYSMDNRLDKIKTILN